MPGDETGSFGEIAREENRGLPDLSLREWAVLAPVVAFIVWIGVYPTAFTGKTEASIEALIAQVQSKAAAQRVSLGPPPPVPVRWRGTQSGPSHIASSRPRAVLVDPTE